MSGNSPYQDLYTVANEGGTQLVVTTIQTGAGANGNNEFTYTYPNGADAKISSTGFIGGTDAIGASTDVKFVNLDKSAQDGLLDDLKLTIVDSQSSRSWHDEPVPVSQYGSAKNPFKLDKPYMILQNQNLEVRFTNNGEKTYIPSLLFHGYRIRLSDADGILSLATA